MNNTVLTDPKSALDQHLHSGIPMVFMSAYLNGLSFDANEQRYQELKDEIRRGGFHYNQIIAKRIVNYYLEKAILFTAENTATIKYTAGDLKNEGLYLASRYDQKYILFVNADNKADIISTQKESFGTVIKSYDHLQLSDLEDYYSKIYSHRFNIQAILPDLTKAHGFFEAMQRESTYNRLKNYRKTGFVIPRSINAGEDKLSTEVKDDISNIVKKLKEGINKSDLGSDLVEVSYSPYDSKQPLCEVNTFIIRISVNTTDYYNAYKKDDSASVLRNLFQTILKEEFKIYDCAEYIKIYDNFGLFQFAFAIYSVNKGWIKLNQNTKGAY